MSLYTNISYFTFELIEIEKYILDWFRSFDKAKVISGKFSPSPQFHLELTRI